MPGVRNIRWILRDTLAILVWHAVFSSLGNTFKAPQRYASLDTRLLFTGRATSSHRFHSSDMCVACLFGKHVTPVTGMPVANGPSPKHLLYSVVLLCASLLFPSAALAAVNAVSVKQQMCEKTRVCLFTHVLYVDMCWRVQRLLRCCLDGSLVMELETLFLFIPVPAVTVVSGESLLNWVHLENCQIH